MQDQIEHLIPTPTDALSKGGQKSRSGSRAGEPLLGNADLFPTPSASRFNDSEDPEQWQARYDRHASKAEGATRAGKPLAIAAAELLPTPQGDIVLHHEIDFGKYAAAVERAARTIERAAPSPVKFDGRDGQRRLSSLFVEWMQMLPEGWVTGHGIGRNPELARLGNGVVPLQAAYAVRMLLCRAFGVGS